MTNKQREQYLYKIVKRTLEWTEAEAKESEIWDLIMLELMNIDEKAVSL